MFSAVMNGFLLQMGLIVAIGAQNAFVLKQGLKREHVAPVCAICAASDAVLIAAGVGGFGAVLAFAPWLNLVLRLFGAVFLAVYGLKNAAAAWRGTDSLDPSAQKTGSLAAAVGTCLVFTWLNPHVYLDTVVLIGSVSTKYPGHGFAFGLGASLASVVFFFSLGYGARFLRPVLAKPQAWRLLEGLIALTMWGIAAGLLCG
jgi:L-lysine exporter family protein LysE/ArgO